MAGTAVEIAIKAVDETNAAIGAAKKNLASLTGTAQTTGNQAGQALSNGFKISGNVIGQAISRISPALGSIVTAAGPAGIALAAVTAGVMAFKQAWTLAEKGAGASELADKFVEIAGGISASEEMMQKLRKATQGTVTDMDLMIVANRSINMGVTKNADDMAKLAAIFTDLGDASSMSAKESVAAGMQAIAALQTRGLKTLGLSLDDSKIYDAYAAKLGTVASALDDVQKRAALVQAVLATNPTALADATASSADNAEAMHVAIENLNISIGQSIQGMLGFGDAVTTIANKANDALKRSLGAAGMATEYQALYEKAVAQFKPKQVWNDVVQEWQDTGNVALQAAVLAQKMQDVIDKFAQGKISYDDARTALDAYVGVNLESVAALDLTSHGMMMASNGAIMLAQNIAAIPTHVGVTVDFNVITPPATLLNASDFATPRWATAAGLGLGATGAGYASRTSANPMSDYSPETLAANKAAEAAGKQSASSYASAYESEMNRRTSELRSIATNAFTPSYRGPDDLVGPYIEQWDEYARKMNAIADDSDTMWRSLVPQDIMAQGQEAIAKWAREEEKAFYAGQRSGEVNWAKFVEDAKKQVELAQAKEDLIAIGMQKLAEAGIGGVSAAEVLGLNAPGATAGADMSASFTAGLVSSDTALAVTTAFQTQMAAQQATWNSVGALCVGWFVAGVTGGITPDIGKALATAMFPFLKPLIGDEVLAKMRAAGL